MGRTRPLVIARNPLHRWLIDTVRDGLDEMKISQTKLAEMADLSQKHVSQVLIGHTVASVETWDYLLLITGRRCAIPGLTSSTRPAPVELAVDRKVGAAYMTLSDREIVKTVEVGGLLIDLDKAGVAVGVEVLDMDELSVNVRNVRRPRLESGPGPSQDSSATGGISSELAG